MCMISLVMDSVTASPPTMGSFWPLVPISQSFPNFSLDELNSLKELISSAKKFDEVTKQPNCEDPEKLKKMNHLLSQIVAKSREIEDVVNEIRKLINV